MSDQDRKSRIRWTAQERQAVASSMLRLLKATPKLTKLQAVTHAQTVLPPSRRRAIQSWASVQGLLQPHMKDAAAAVGADEDVDDTETQDAATTADPSPNASRQDAPPADSADAASGAATATDDEPPAEDEAPMAAGTPAAATDAASAPTGSGTGGPPRTGPAAAAPLPATVTASIAAPLVDALNGLSGALGDMLARSFGDALLRAVASPAFAEALAAQVTIAVNEAVARLPAPAPSREAAPAETAPAPPPARPTPRPRVLVAGLLPGHADELRSEFGTTIDLRFWRPGESREQLKSAARGCAVAVVIADAVDATVEGELRGLMMRPIRHSGNLAQLKTRLHELVEHNLFGMLGS